MFAAKSRKFRDQNTAYVSINLNIIGAEPWLIWIMLFSVLVTESIIYWFENINVNMLYNNIICNVYEVILYIIMLFA